MKKTGKDVKAERDARYKLAGEIREQMHAEADRLYRAGELDKYIALVTGEPGDVEFEFVKRDELLDRLEAQGTPYETWERSKEGRGFVLTKQDRVPGLGLELGGYDYLVSALGGFAKAAYLPHQFEGAAGLIDEESGEESARDIAFEPGHFVGEWKVKRVTYQPGDEELYDAGFESWEEAHFEGVEIPPKVYDAKTLGIDSDFLRFHEDGQADFQYFGAHGEGQWSVEGGRITRTRKFYDPDHFRISEDGETLYFDTFDEEQDREMVVEYTR